MGFATISCVALLILLGERGFIRGQGPIGGEDGSDCCPLISVNVGGPHASLAGQYNLKDKQGSKPEDCINGCIYMKHGSPSTDKYCFKTEQEVGADVQCLVGI